MIEPNFAHDGRMRASHRACSTCGDDSTYSSVVGALPVSSTVGFGKCLLKTRLKDFLFADRRTCALYACVRSWRKVFLFFRHSTT